MIFSNQQAAFKIRFSFGYLLEHPSEGQRFFHPSSNNAAVLDAPMLIRTQNDFIDFLDEVFDTDNLEWARLQRPNSSFVVSAITNIVFYVYPLRGVTIG